MVWLYRSLIPVRGGEGGYLTCFKWFLPAFAAPKGRRGRSELVGHWALCLQRGVYISKMSPLEIKTVWFGYINQESQRGGDESFLFTWWLLPVTACARGEWNQYCYVKSDLQSTKGTLLLDEMPKLHTPSPPPPPNPPNNTLVIFTQLYCSRAESICRKEHSF